MEHGLRHRGTGLGIQTNKLRLTTKSAQQRVKMFVYDDCMNLAVMTVVAMAMAMMVMVMVMMTAMHE